MKRFLIALLTLTLLMANTAFAALTPNGEFPLVDEPTEITVWAAIPGGMVDYVNNATTAFYEAKTGIHVNWIEAPSAERSTLFNTSLASGDYPDFYCDSGSGADLISYYNDGVIIPLNDLIENHSFYLKQLLEENPDVKAAITAPDGNIYSLPRLKYASSNDNSSRIFVYKEWLKKYTEETGKPVPNTIEGFQDLLTYFRDNDMNGNGDATDEIVLTGHYQYTNSGIPVFYMLNAFCFIPNNYFYVNDEGKITSDVKTEGFRDGLRYANKLYEEGLMSEEIFVQGLTTFRSLTTTTRDKVVVAACCAPYPFRTLTMQPGVENAVVWQDYEMLPPLERADGSMTLVPGIKKENLTLSGMITTACDNPEIVMRWVDGLYSPEMRNYMFYGGVEGEGWEWQDGVKSVGGADRAVVSKLPADVKSAIWLPDWVGGCWITEETYASVAATSDGAEEPLRYANNQIWGPYEKDISVPTITWCMDEDLAIEYSELKTLFENYLNTAISEFTLGIRDIDDDGVWQEYLDTLDAMQYDHYCEVATQYYFD